MTVVSQYGAELAAHEGITVHTGRLDQEAMQQLIKEHNVRLLIDASHPYAAIVTATAQDAAKAEGKDYEIFAKSTSDIDAELASDHKPDVLLLGPQVGYLKNDVKKKTDEAGIPMDVINMMDYGMMKGDKVLAAAEAMM